MMVYWRFKDGQDKTWKFGYMTRLGDGLVRMGLNNGDTTHGPIVSEFEIETKDHQ